MPIFNTRGDAAGGRVTPWINGVVPPLLARTHGGGPCWATDDTLLFNARVTESPEVYATNLYAIIGQVVGPIGPGANDRVGGGGVWATKDNRGYRDSLGRTDETGKWHPLAVCEQTGDVAICSDVTADPARGLIVLSRSGGFTLVHAGSLDSLEACFDGGVLVYEADGVLKTWSRDAAATWYPKFGVRGVRHSGGWRVGFSDNLSATVVHALGSNDARIVSRGHADFYPDIHVANGVITVATSAGQAEHAHEYKRFVVDDAMPHVNLAAPVHAPVVPIGRPLWFGFFEFRAAPTGQPSNCRIPVQQGAAWLDVIGPGWRYAAGNPDGNISAIADAIYAAAGARPVVAYVPRRAQYAIEALRADIVGVEAYLGADETDAQFMARISDSLRRSPRAVLIAQCYTSNTNNTQDLRRIPGLISALARDHANVEGIFVFSAGSRATGWDDHPEVHDDWRQVFNGITGAPDVAKPSPPVKPEPVPTPPVEIPTPQPEPLPEPEPEPVPAPDNTPAPAPEVNPVTKKKINGVKIVKDLFRALAKWDVAKLLGIKKPKRQAPVPHVPEPPPAAEPTQQPPAPQPLRNATRDEVLSYRGHLGDIRDSASRVIWTAGIHGLPPENRAEWLRIYVAKGATHIPVGPFDPGVSYPGLGVPDSPDWNENASAIRSLLDEIRAVETVRGHGLIPVIFPDGCGREDNGRRAVDRIGRSYPTVATAIEGLEDQVIVVIPGWEPHDMTAREQWDAHQFWFRLMEGRPKPVTAWHGWPERSNGASNDPDNQLNDDPFLADRDPVTGKAYGSGAKFWQMTKFDMFLYQLEPELVRTMEQANCGHIAPPGQGVYHEGCWLDNLLHAMCRVGGVGTVDGRGAITGPPWVHKTFVVFETTTRLNVRGQTHEGVTQRVNDRALELSRQYGIDIGFGTGLPTELETP